MKKVLIIAQRFPPAGGVGTFRVAKFVKYLKEFGWEPSVITINRNLYTGLTWYDNDLEKDIPGDVNIYRTDIWQFPYINDEGVKWVPYLFINAIKIIRKERSQLVYITGGPFLPLVVGPFIKFLFKLPYIIDLRDPWKLAYHRVTNKGLKNQLMRLLDNIAEPIVINQASRVICATYQMRKEYQSAYPERSDKFYTITNGYDPDDFYQVRPRRYKKFTIVYTGKFERSEAFHNPLLFFKALKIIQNKKIEIQFIHVGAKEEKVINMSHEIGLSDIVMFVGPKSHSETLSYAMGADLLLVIGSDRKMGLPVKMFDYIGCNKPILFLAYKDEEMWGVGQEIPLATLLENKSAKEIAYVIEKIYKKHHGEKFSKIIFSKYHRKILTGSLSEIFNKVLADR